jgi:small-conductance mechanosensitive channel
VTDGTTGLPEVGDGLLLPAVLVQELDEPWRTLLGRPLAILVIVVLSLLVRWLLHRLIDRLVARALETGDRRVGTLRTVAGGALLEVTGLGRERQRQRMQSTASFLKSTVTAVVVGVMVLTVLELVGIPLAPLLASASVGGLAVAFGAQSLVKDFLSGIFLLAEDQFGVGDVIDTGNVVGTVEEVTLRLTRIRDGDGVVWYVRNGEILRIGNRSQGWSVANVDVTVSAQEDLARVTSLLESVAGEVAGDATWADRLVDAPTVAGVEALAAGTLVLRLTARCRANAQPDVQRELRRRVADAFQAAGVSTVAAPA